MANKVTVLIDVAVDRANRGLTSFRNAINDADGAVNKFKAGAASASSALKANAGPALAAAGAGFVALSRTAINAASSLEQSVGAVESAFGDASDAILEMSRESSQAFGLSAREFNEAAVQFSGAALKISEDTGKPVAEVIRELVGTSADLAATFGGPVSEAIDKVAAGLAGESEPLRRWNIDVRKTAVDANAAAMGMSDAADMTKIYGTIMSDSSRFAGQFAREANTLAGQQQRVNATAEDLSATLGKHLMPAVMRTTEQINNLAKAADDLGLIDVAAKMQQWTNPINLVQRGLSVARQETDLFGRSVSTVTDEQFEFVKAMSDAGFKLEEIAEAQARGVTTLDQYVQGLRYAEQAEGDYSEAVKITTDEVEDNTEAEQERERQLEDSRRALERMNDATIESIDAGLRYRNTAARTSQAIAEYNEQVARGELSTEAMAQASRDAEAAALDQAAAAVANAEAQAQASGQTLTAQQRTTIYRDELARLAASLNGDAAFAIAMHIERLRQIPRSIATDVVSTFRTSGGTGNAMLRVVGRAGGGVVSEPVTLVGERGPELVSLPNGSRVHTASQTEQMFGGTTIHIGNLSLPNVTNPREFVEALNRYAANGGAKISPRAIGP